MSNDNIVSLVPGQKDEIPTSDYVVTSLNGEEFFASGFLVFTSHHIAVMRDTGAGALPVLVVPLTMVSAAELVEDNDDEEVFN